VNTLELNHNKALNKLFFGGIVTYLLIHVLTYWRCVGEWCAAVEGGCMSCRCQLTSAC